MAIKQDVNAPLIVTTGVVSGLLLLVIVFGLQAWFVREEQSEIAEKWGESGTSKYVEMKAEQRTKIEKAGVDEQTKARTIPIEQAMQVVIQTGGKLPSTQPASGGGQPSQQK
jgi:hypothetical protein